MDISRRDFLKAIGAAGAAASLPGSWMRGAAAFAGRARDLTTLGGTIVKGALGGEGSIAKYYRLAVGPGEPHMTRDELAATSVTGSKNRRSLISFVHYTDIHLIDPQSPARVEFLDRFADRGQGCESIPFESAFRPQETLTLHVLEAMNRRLREIQVSPVTGAPISLAVCTGDNIDNEQFNEMRWFVDLMDGKKIVDPNSGTPDVYEGVQSPDWGDPEYWHPDAEIADKYKQQYGFPEYPGLLEESVKPFRAVGVGRPWLQTYGNHDGLLQGNAPRNPIFEGIAVGGTKFMGGPPGLNPCDAFQTMRDNPAAFAAAPVHPVGADANRRIITRREYAAELFKTTGTPAGHGLTQADAEAGIAYWVNDGRPMFRLIGLDTVNPGGESSGSIGMQQFNWLEQKLIEVSSVYFDANGDEATTDNPDRYVILFSHHGLRSLDNRVITPDPLEPASSDLPRMMAPEVEALVHRFPNVIAWVNGHTHENLVEARQGPNGTGFWDIGTAAHIDWSCQSRLVEVLDNGDGTLSIVCTMVDHAAPAMPGGRDPVLRLASISRELAANDYQKGFASSGPGEPQDRNVDLVVRAPFAPPRKPARRAALTGAPA